MSQFIMNMRYFDPRSKTMENVALLSIMPGRYVVNEQYKTPFVDVMHWTGRYDANKSKIFEEDVLTGGAVVKLDILTARHMVAQMTLHEFLTKNPEAIIESNTYENK